MSGLRASVEGDVVWVTLPSGIALAYSRHDARSLGQMMLDRDEPWGLLGQHKRDVGALLLRYSETGEVTT